MITDLMMILIICLFMFGSGEVINQHPPSAKRRLQRRAGRTLSPPNMNSTYVKKLRGRSQATSPITTSTTLKTAVATLRHRTLPSTT